MPKSTPKRTTKKVVKKSVKTSPKTVVHKEEKVVANNFFPTFLLVMLFVLGIIWGFGSLGGLNGAGSTSVINSSNPNACTTCEAKPSADTAPFSDVTQPGPFYDAIKYLKGKGLINGNPDGTFKPTSYLNRAEAMVIIGRALNVDLTTASSGNCFNDVKTEWFAPYVCYAKMKGWISGVGDNNFNPTGLVTRAEGWKMVLGAFAVQLDSQLDPKAKGYTPTDVNSADWFAKYVYTVYNRGWMTPDVYDPNNPNAFMNKQVSTDTQQFADYTHFDAGMWLERQDVAYMLYKVLTEAVPTI